MIPTLFFDVAVDCFFIVDIFVNFNTGISHKHTLEPTWVLSIRFWFCQPHNKGVAEWSNC